MSICTQACPPGLNPDAKKNLSQLAGDQFQSSSLPDNFYWSVMIDDECTNEKALKALDTIGNDSKLLLA